MRRGEYDGQDIELEQDGKPIKWTCDEVVALGYTNWELVAKEFGTFQDGPLHLIFIIFFHGQKYIIICQFMSLGT